MARLSDDRGLGCKHRGKKYAVCGLFPQKLTRLVIQKFLYYNLSFNINSRAAGDRTVPTFMENEESGPSWQPRNFRPNNNTNN